LLRMFIGAAVRTGMFLIGTAFILGFLAGFLLMSLLLADRGRGLRERITPAEEPDPRWGFVALC